MVKVAVRLRICGFSGAQVALPQHTPPQPETVRQVVDALEQQVGQQPDRFDIVTDGVAGG